MVTATPQEDQKIDAVMSGSKLHSLYLYYDAKWAGIGCKSAATAVIN
jgi:hypothetical protein